LKPSLLASSSSSSPSLFSKSRNAQPPCRHTHQTSTTL
jgi:hypothetical protein